MRRPAPRSNQPLHRCQVEGAPGPSHLGTGEVAAPRRHAFSLRTISPRRRTLVSDPFSPETRMHEAPQTCLVHDTLDVVRDFIACVAQDLPPFPMPTAPLFSMPTPSLQRSMRKKRPPEKYPLPPGGRFALSSPSSKNTQNSATPSMTNGTANAASLTHELANLLAEARLLQ